MPETTKYHHEKLDDGPALETLLATNAYSGSIGFTDDYRADLPKAHCELAE